MFLWLLWVNLANWSVPKRGSWNSHLQMVDQKHSWQPGLWAGIWSGEAVFGTEPFTCGCEALQVELNGGTPSWAYSCGQRVPCWGLEKLHTSLAWKGVLSAGMRSTEGNLKRWQVQVGGDLRVRTVPSHWSSSGCVAWPDCARGGGQSLPEPDEEAGGKIRERWWRVTKRRRDGQREAHST